MKQIILITIFVFLMCSFSSAQSPLPELEKAKEIKLLATSRYEVRKIFADYNSDISDDGQYYQWFSSDNANIKISYSSGNCSNTFEEWNIPEWKVSDISITLKNPVKTVGIDYSKYKKEKKYSNISSQFIFHDKYKGIAFEVYKNKIYTIYLFPSKKDHSLIVYQRSRKKVLFE